MEGIFQEAGKTFAKTRRQEVPKCQGTPEARWLQDRKAPVGGGKR